MIAMRLDEAHFSAQLQFLELAADQRVPMKIDVAAL
jgi:hypothetical protein